MINSCYLCGGKVTFFIKKNGYQIFRCNTCGLGQTELQQTYESFVHDHYNKGYFTGDKTRAAYVDYLNDKTYITRNMRKFMRRILKYKSHGRLLDVGCALGFFVEIALQKGFDAYGFDPSEYAIQQAKKLIDKNRFTQGTINQISYKPKSFDVITLFDVFEHLHDPLGDIQKLSGFLKDDGIMIIATGDTNSIMAKILKRRWTFYIPPQHLFFFNKNTITMLMNKSGLDTVEYFRIGKWLSLRYVLHLARTTGESVIARFLYSLTQKIGTHQFPLYLSVGDNIVTIIKKKSQS